MVESGFGICIMPSLTLERVHGDVETYAIEPMEYREFGIAVLNPQMMAPAVRQMAMFIESFARQKAARGAGDERRIRSGKTRFNRDSARMRDRL